jgi:purine-nucleoside phosphorylase
MLQKIEATAKFLKEKTGFTGKTAVILGSGLGNFADKIDVTHTLAYKDIPNFPVSTVKGHSGELVFGHFRGKEIVAMKGRFHYYEGYSVHEVTFPVRVFKALGIENLFVSNAAGGTNYSFEVGNIMMITDHVNLTGTNPLIGKNEDSLGPRFPDMTKAYYPAFFDKAREIAFKNNIVLYEGVYVGLTGPSFETPAEYRFLNTIGGDAVGMSTVFEVIVANHMRMKVFGVSAITNNGLLPPEEGNSHKEVLDIANVVAPKLEVLFGEMIASLD